MSPGFLKSYESKSLEFTKSQESKSQKFYQSLFNMSLRILPAISCH
jgi:hypothetical protein